MNPKLREKLHEALAAVLPISLIVLVLSVLLVPMHTGTLVMFLTGAVMLVIGMSFFQLGAEIAMSPLGEAVGVRMARSRHIPLVLLAGLAIGAVVTLAEPDLQVLAQQVPAIPNQVLVLTVAAGVGVFLASAVFRILGQFNLNRLLLLLYIPLIVLSCFVPAAFLPLAFDAGGVTTGPVTVPFIMALGAGIALVRSDKSASDDSFGLVALSSVGPVLAVMLLGLFYNPSEALYTTNLIPEVDTTRDVVRIFLTGLPGYLREVALSVLPLVALFWLVQWSGRRYTWRQIRRILVGFVYTFVGLVLFLCGVNVGFSPVGALLGGQIAAGEHPWLLIPISMLIGFYIVKAEPAIAVLNRQIQSVTDGAVSQRAMNRCLSIGVCVSAGLSALRVLTGLPLQWIVIPGYIAAMVMSYFVPPIFVGIAFDSGGVASGPMTTTFLLPLCIGACEAAGGNVMTDAFGVVALVALTPLIAVQIMGLTAKARQRSGIVAEEAPAALPPADSDEIIDLMEGI